MAKLSGREAAILIVFVMIAVLVAGILAILSIMENGVYNYGGGSFAHSQSSSRVAP